MATAGRVVAMVGDGGDLGADEDVSALAVALLAAIQGGMLLSQVNRDATAYRRAVNVVIDHIADRVAVAQALRSTDR